MLIRPPCECCCLVRSDDFDRPDETFGSTDSTGNWSDNGTPKFQIVSNQLVCVTASQSANAFAPALSVRGLTHDERRAISESWDFNLPENGKIRLSLSISPPNESAIDFLSVYLEIAVTTAEADCGTMTLMTQDSETGEPTALADPIPVGGLVPGVWGNARLCIDFDLSFATATITLPGGQQATHAKDIPHVTGTGGSNGPLFNIAAGLWCDRTITGTYTFDNYRLEQIRTHGSYAVADPECPVCRKTDAGLCEDHVINLDDDLDCRWTPDEYGGGGGCWGGSSSGVDANGQLDDSARVEMQFHIPAAGGTASVNIGASTLSWSIDADGEFTLSLSTGETESGSAPAILDRDASLILCCLDNLLIGSIGVGEVNFGRSLHHIGIQSCQGEACGHASGPIAFIAISHNLHTQDGSCFKCFPEPFLTPCGDCTVPAHKTVAIQVSETNETGDGCQATCSWGSWSLDKVPPQAGFEEPACYWQLDVPHGETWPFDYCPGVVALGGVSAVALWYFSEVEWMCSGQGPTSWSPGDPRPQFPDATPQLAIVHECGPDLSNAGAELALGHQVLLLQRVYFCPRVLVYPTAGAFAQLEGDLYTLNLFATGFPPASVFLEVISHAFTQCFQAFGDPLPDGADPCDNFSIELRNSAGVCQSGNDLTPCNLRTARLIVT